MLRCSAAERVTVESMESLRAYPRESREKLQIRVKDLSGEILNAPCHPLPDELLQWTAPYSYYNRTVKALYNSFGPPRLSACVSPSLPKCGTLLPVPNEIHYILIGRMYPCRSQTTYIKDARSTRFELTCSVGRLSDAEHRHPILLAA